MSEEMHTAYEWAKLLNGTVVDKDERTPDGMAYYEVEISRNEYERWSSNDIK